MLDSYVNKERDKAAALEFIKTALKRHGSPEAIVTDGLRSYGAALKELNIQDRQEVGRWQNTRAGSRPSGAAAGNPPVQTRHLGGGEGLVDEDQALWVQIELVLEPGAATPKEVGTILLRRMPGLFSA